MRCGGSVAPRWALEQLWLFILAPLAGALLGAGVHAALFSRSEPVDRAESAVEADRA